MAQLNTLLPYLSYTSPLSPRHLFYISQVAQFDAVLPPAMKEEPPLQP